MLPKLKANIRIQRIQSIWYMLQSVSIAVLFPLIGQIYGHVVYSDIQYLIDSTSVSISTYVIMSIVLHIIHQIAGFYGIAAYILLKYVVQTVVIQLNILANYIQQVSGYDDDDHLSVKKHLRICAIHHTLLLRMFKIIQEFTYSPFLFMLFFGQLVLLCCIIYLYYNLKVHDIFQIGSILLLSYVLAMDCCQGGQDATDAFDEFTLNILRLKWYKWNEVNKKVLLIMLSRTQREEKMATLGLCFDRTLMVKIMKFSYQAMLIFFKLTQDE
ncbi:odorant receptor 46a-like [Harmonia axyridis]|uniref:odorant receptor 46a-like n=1 Tax=Harmonia axyridis TaxID=115357 RepID=UPI001E276E69|nr:odorant receptor 46a-like [Harmonia axyridis]